MSSWPKRQGDTADFELWRSDAEALSLRWNLVDPFPTVYELCEGDHRYAALRRPPREGWLWSGEWIAESATSRWAIREGGVPFIHARDRIIDMATDSLLGVFRSWFSSSGVLELTDAECFNWKAPWREAKYFADNDGNAQVMFERCKDELGPYCWVDLVNSAPRSPHCLLLLLWLPSSPGPTRTEIGGRWGVWRVVPAWPAASRVRTPSDAPPPV
jgi:hypothetical protein